MTFENLTDDEKTIVYITVGVGGGLIVILFILSIYLVTVVTSLKKKLKKDKNEKEDDEDNDSIEDGTTRQTINNQPYNQHVYDQDLNHEPPFMVNPYNPTETYQIRRAKLIQSLRNKISHPNSRSDHDYPPSDLNSNYEDDYPHPKNGTLKNEILQARSKMSKKPPAPKDWTAPGDRRSYSEKQMSPPISGEYNLPPRDYPGFPSSHNSQFNRKPYAQSVDNYGGKTRGMSRQEAEVMKQYDQTIANEERHFHNQGYLHGRYGK